VDRSGRPKLLDFGVARLLDEVVDASQTVERLLTPDYASPEQLAGRDDTLATDVYSLGAVLHHLLAGVAPRQDNLGQSIRAISQQSLATFSRELGFIVAKALRIEPEERYVSVDDFASDVQTVLDSAPFSTEYPKRPLSIRNILPSVKIRDYLE
jgi:serine/threonine protein kinase